MFRYGWLTVTAEDLAVWQQFPDAAFTLVNLPSDPDAPEEFHLGAFEIPTPTLDRRTLIGTTSHLQIRKSAGVASTARGGTMRGASRLAVASFSSAIAGDHGRSMPLGLTASTTNPSRPRRNAIAPCRRSRSASMTEAAQDAGACLVVTISAARSQSSASASGLNACATRPPPAACITQPRSSQDTPAVE